MDDVSDKPNEPNELFAIEGYAEMLNIVGSLYTQEELDKIQALITKWEAELARRKSGTTDTSSHHNT